MYQLYSYLSQCLVSCIIVLFATLVMMFPGKGIAFELVNGKPVVLAVFHANSSAGSQKVTSKEGDLFSNGYELKDRYGDQPYLLLDGHLGFGTNNRTMVGSTYVGNDHYHEWQILVARAANIDGFIVEWGYNNDESTPDKAIRSQKKVLRRLQKEGEDSFPVVPLWIPSWFTKNRSQEYWKENYKSQINKIIFQFYQNNDGISYDKRPLLFVLDLGIKHKSLKRSLLSGFFGMKRFEHNPQFIWRMGEADSNSWRHNISLIPEVIGNLPWIIPRERPATISNSTFIKRNFGRFGNHQDIKETVDRLNALNKKYEDRISLRVQSVSPGMDTRYAKWNKAKKILMRSENGINTFEYAWDQVMLDSHDKPDIVLIETFNDFSEGTHIEPTEVGGFDNIAISAKKACLLKRGSGMEEYLCDHQENQARLLSCHASKIYKSRKLLSILEKNQGDNSLMLNESENILNSWSESVFKRIIDASGMYESQLQKIIEAAPLGVEKIEITDLSYTLSPSVATTEIVVFQKVSSYKKTLLDQGGRNSSVNGTVSGNSASDANLPERGSKDYQFKIQLGDRINFLENDYQISAASITLSRTGEYSSDEKPLEVYQVHPDKKDELVAKIYLDKNQSSLNTIISLDSQHSEGVFHQQYKIVNPSLHFELNKLFIENYFSSKCGKPENGWIEAVNLSRNCDAF